MAQEGKSFLQLLYEKDDECPPERFATLKDAANTLIFVVGAYLVEHVIGLLFPESVAFETQLVVKLSGWTFILLILGIFINRARCTLRQLAKMIYEARQYPEILAKKEKPASTVTSTAKKKKSKK